MKKEGLTMYFNFTTYLAANELNDLATDVENDTNVEFLMSFVKDHLEDSEILKTLDTGVIHDMFLYYVNHKS